MTCIDCEEEFTEAERRSARSCVVCSGLMHAECSMVGIDDASDTCERCLGLESAGYDAAMEDNSNLRNEDERLWWHQLGTDKEVKA